MRSMLKKGVYLTCNIFQIIISPSRSGILLQITSVIVIQDVVRERNQKLLQKYIVLVIFGILLLEHWEQNYHSVVTKEY